MKGSVDSGFCPRSPDALAATHPKPFSGDFVRPALGAVCFVVLNFGGEEMTSFYAFAGQEGHVSGEEARRICSSFVVSSCQPAVIEVEPGHSVFNVPVPYDPFVNRPRKTGCDPVGGMEKAA